MQRFKVTDTKHNKHAVLPKPIAASREAMIAVRATEWAKVREEYMEEFTKEDGKQESNLTASQGRGVKSLLRRVKEGDIVVIQTDKSGILVVMSMEEYLKAGTVHTAKDDETNHEFAKENQRLLNGHSSMYLKIFNVGSDWNHETRHRETKLNKSCAIPVLRLLFKDHKNWKPSDGPPPTRPVCGANTGMNVHFSDLLSMILEPLATSLPGSWEVISTDDYISKCDDYNGEEDKKETANELPGDQKESELPGKGEESKCQETNGEPVVVGFDYVSLYPSLEAEMAAREAHDAVMLSPLQFSGVNYKEACRYIAANTTEQEVAVNKLRRVLPWRPTNMGTRPGVTGPEAMGPHSDDEELWSFPRGVRLTTLEKRMAVAQVVAIGVKTMFRTHVYTFGGKLFHQKRGGPIGLRGTGAVARVVMAMCDTKVKAKMDNNTIKTMVDARYMDDVRNQLMPIRSGWRWNGNQMEQRKEWQLADEEESVSRQGRTARTLKGIMNSIHPELVCTSEVGEEFEDGRLPTLDTNVWIEDGRVKYSFFEKPTATSKVIHKKSALSENCKMASLSQNLVRRMRNTSELVAIEERVKIVDKYTGKLINSGYSMVQSRRIVVAGLRGYEASLRRVERTGQKLHRSAAEGAVKRNRKKLLAKSNWFKEKREKLRDWKKREKLWREFHHSLHGCLLLQRAQSAREWSHGVM